MHFCRYEAKQPNLKLKNSAQTTFGFSHVSSCAPQFLQSF
jgi:hypothetical protein